MTEMPKQWLFITCVSQKKKKKVKFQPILSQFELKAGTHINTVPLIITMNWTKLGRVCSSLSLGVDQWQ